MRTASCAHSLMLTAYCLSLGQYYNPNTCTFTLPQLLLTDSLTLSDDSARLGASDSVNSLILAVLILTVGGNPLQLASQL
jgi:hypothetical protein